MISLTVKAYLKNRLGTAFRFYRVLFNLASALTFFPLISYSQSLNDGVLFMWDGPWLVARWTLLAIAAVLLVLGGMRHDMLRFLGISQLRKRSSDAAPWGPGPIDTSGVLGLVRHPWYLAALVLVWTFESGIHFSTLIVNIILSTYLIVGTILEERKLVVEYGDEYRDYKQRVSMLVPVKWVRHGMSRSDKPDSRSS